MARKSPRHFLVQNLLKNAFFYTFNVELTGAARPYRAASSDRRERG